MYRPPPVVSGGTTGLGIRRRLIANTPFYVAPPPLGNDSYSGRLSLFPKATIQAMSDDLQDNYDLGGFLATINLADGDYTAGAIINDGFVGAGTYPPVQIIGNETHSENVRISTTSNAFEFHNTTILLAGMKLTTDAGGGGSLLRIYDYSNVYHRNLWLAGAGHEYIECHLTSTCFATGPTRVSGVGDSFCHFTENSQITWEDQTITLVTADGVTLGTTTTGPMFENYIFGGNRATCTLGRTTVVGSFGCDVSHLSRHFIHIGAKLNLSACIGIEALFPGQSPPVNEAGGQTIYDEGVGNTIYCRLDAAGNNGDGYANNATRAFLLFSSAAAYLAARPPDQIFNAIPIIQCAAGTWSAFRLPDIPGVAEVILLGDETTPSNCLVSTTGAHCFETLGVQTKWHIRGFRGVSTGAGIIAPSTSAPVAAQNVTLGAAGGSAQIIQSLGSSFQATGPLTVDGGGSSFLNNGGGLTVITTTVTFTGALTYSVATVFGRRKANIRWTGTKTIGTSVTGTRVNLADGAYVDSNNPSNQNGIPGSADGPVDAASFAHMT